MSQGQRRITFDGFLASLLEIADKKNMPLDVLVDHILSAGGPTVTATKADYVKFHDDKVWQARPTVAAKMHHSLAPGLNLLIPILV